MSDRAAFSGSYADIKTVKTRGVFQVLVEIPIEQYQAFVAAFGGPMPGQERPVALALLHASPDTGSPLADNATGQQRGEVGKPRKPFHEMSRAQQAGILCGDTKFKLWLSTAFPLAVQHADDTADAIRSMCCVGSRSELDTRDAAGMRWDRLVAQFRAETGQMAEVRE